MLKTSIWNNASTKSGWQLEIVKLAICCYIHSQTLEDVIVWHSLMTSLSDWFPTINGSGKHLNVLSDAYSRYRTGAELLTHIDAHQPAAQEIQQQATQCRSVSSIVRRLVASRDTPKIVNHKGDYRSNEMTYTKANVRRYSLPRRPIPQNVQLHHFDL